MSGVRPAISPESPESRRAHPGAHPARPGLFGLIAPGSFAFETLRRVAVGVWHEGFIHAGNLAYLTLLSIFPFFIVGAAILTAIGRPEDFAALEAVLATLPPSVGAMIGESVRQVLSLRTGPLLWFGALIGIWTVTSFIETIREVLRRAYGVSDSRPFWHYRLLGIAMIFAAVALLMIAFAAQIAMTTAEEVIARFLPAAHQIADMLAGSRAFPTIATYIAAFIMFWVLAPSRYRGRGYPKWPGALFTSLWWFGSVMLLPRAVGAFGGYTLTYGGLAGVMVALLFFWLVGYGLVIGAHINAALANPEKHRQRGGGFLDELAEAPWLDT